MPMGLELGLRDESRVREPAPCSYRGIDSGDVLDTLVLSAVVVGVGRNEQVEAPREFPSDQIRGQGETQQPAHK